MQMQTLRVNKAEKKNQCGRTSVNQTQWNVSVAKKEGFFWALRYFLSWIWNFSGGYTILVVLENYISTNSTVTTTQRLTATENRHRADFDKNATVGQFIWMLTLQSNSIQ